MKVSLKTIRQYIDFELPPVDELAKRINEQLGGVEEVVDLGTKYKDAVIVKVVECEKHPNADKLSVCKIEDGGVVKDVERDENGLVQIVCGAPNVKAGMYAVWLPPKATVPSSFEDKEPFVLSAREIRGVVSNGMLAAPDELALGSDHDGILEIDPDQWKPTDVEVRPGASFAKSYGLDDYVIDIENKMFTHRPDLFGQLGVAREISAILGGVTKPEEEFADTRYVNPDWYWLLPTFDSASELQLEVFNDAPEKVPRFMAVAMKNVTVGPSPVWLQAALVAMGSKSINNVVDVTNYIMLMTAQPTHAYDYDKLRGHKLGARMAKKGEKAELLNGKTYELSEDDIVIVDGEGVVGLGGVMGGGNSEVSAETKNIVLEVATFDMYTVRKTSMRYGLFTDALTRFNKGQSPLQNGRVLHRLMQIVGDVSGASQASNVYDVPKNDGLDEVSMSGEIRVSTQFINERLGSNLTVHQVGNLLRRTNFASYPPDDDQDSLLITAPFWRTDIEQPEDIVEEVGRLYGFDKLPRELPQRSMKPTATNKTRAAAQKIRESMSKAGAGEVLTYSFVHEKVLKNAEQNPELAFRLGNALSPELQYYRLSILPSLIDKVHMNIKAGHDAFALFEIGKSHAKDQLDDEGLPKEFGRIAAVFASKKSTSAAYYDAKQLLEQLASDFGIKDKLRYQKLTDNPYAEFAPFAQLCAPFDAERSAIVFVGDTLCGVVGEFKGNVAKNFKLPDATAGFELFMSTFENAITNNDTYTPLSRYPSISQDISIRTTNDVDYASLSSLVNEVLALSELEIRTSTIAIYQAADDRDHKTTTFRVSATSYDKTLTDSDLSTLLGRVNSVVSEAIDATVI